SYAPANVVHRARRILEQALVAIVAHVTLFLGPHLANARLIGVGCSLMSRRLICAAVMAVGLAAAAGTWAQSAKPIAASEVPQRKKAAPLPPRGTYEPVRTSWGDPAIAGAYNNSDETGIPFERPDAFAGRTLESFTPEELAAITAERQKQTIERNPTLSEFPGATSPMHWFENYFAANSRPWLVVDPPDGKVPAQTEEARQRAAAARAARAGRGPADSYVDRSLYDRCI